MVLCLVIFGESRIGCPGHRAGHPVEFHYDVKPGCRIKFGSTSELWTVKLYIDVVIKKLSKCNDADLNCGGIFSRNYTGFHCIAQCRCFSENPIGHKCLDGNGLKKYAELFSSDWRNDDGNG
jgi:hypothetical protein